MEYVGLVLAGSVLLIFHVLTLFVMIQDIKRMISCTEIVDAKVETITVKRHRHKDSKTGKTKTKRSYEVTFQYDYNGQTYESFHTYSKRCRYSENEITNIKIDPHDPEESWTKGELESLIIVSLMIPVLAFFDYLYIIIFSHTI